MDENISGTITVPLEGNSDSSSPFWRTGWTGVVGNDILNAGDVDVMVIASFDEFHENQILSCLGKGIHLFVEKPICINRGQLNNITKKIRMLPIQSYLFQKIYDYSLEISRKELKTDKSINLKRRSSQREMYRIL